MKIFVAGATGAIGKRLIPLLVQFGHSATGTTRSPRKADVLRMMGAVPVVVDALDRNALIEAVKRAEPEVIVHELTAIRPGFNVRKFRDEFAVTTRLRTEGTDNLLAAAHATAVRRFVAQSYAGLPFARVGGPVKTEDDPLDCDPPPALAETLGAIRHLESTVCKDSRTEGVVLRYGALYGPGTSIAIGGALVEQVRKRKFPMVGTGAGIWSFVHVDDAAQATLMAVEAKVTGIFNIVDDDPTPVSQWLPALAQMLEAKEPQHVPAWFARLFVGKLGVIMMTEVRGGTNAKAKQLLGWRPRWTSWRDGFRHGLGNGR